MEGVPAYLRGFETRSIFIVSSTSVKFQHTYEGSKLEGFFSGGRDSAGSSIPTRVRNCWMVLWVRGCMLVPAYLRGFETVSDHRLLSCRFEVPAYLRGFETLEESDVEIWVMLEFQHTYEGSKLGTVYDSPDSTGVFQHTYEGSKHSA